ncbi:MAG: hypothetical protein IJ251_03740, partial [Oscillospiraceae bacterium]|nr:hypothetical protein [Oscillospiraceae bacterium]
MTLKSIMRLGRSALRDPRAALAHLKDVYSSRKLAGLVRNSPYFDEEYYRRNNADLAKVKDLALHYLLHGKIRTPSPFFSGEEYLALNLDVARAGVNPIVHYELHGREEGRLVSCLQESEPVFPSDAVSCARRYDTRPVLHRRTAVLSCYTGGIIPETLYILMRGLLCVCDNIILIGDCPLIPSELDKLGEYVCYASFERHSQYDFGSYKRGLAYAEENGITDRTVCDELILINDSCIGPVFPFEESFTLMGGRPCDFWGYSIYRSAGEEHISSYFIVLKRNVLDSGEAGKFLSRVEGKYDRGRVIYSLETVFTSYLHSKGFEYDAVCRDENIFQRPLTFLEKYRVPLVKKKVFTRKEREDMSKVTDIIRKNSPELAPYAVFSPVEPADFHIPSIEEHRRSFPEKVQRIARKCRSGEKIRALFLINNCSIFPSRPLYDEMLSDPAFDPYICVIPDLRWKKDPFIEMEKHEQTLLSEGISEERLIRVRTDDVGRWQDITDGMDVVCYNTPYELSSFRYSHRYSAGRDFLPVMVNYGFYRSYYDDHILRLENYRYMWKAFFECGDTLAQYAAASADGGDNAFVSGYIKMDGLYAHKPRQHDGRRILLALHHSVDGGANDTLSL